MTALIPLTTYTLLILFRNFAAGFTSVPADILEAAEGMGYTRRQRLRRVELPLAVPLIIAGIRLASVTTIGLATVAAVLGDAFGGLGQLITEGIQTFFPTKYLLGAVLSVLLAFAADSLFVQARAGRHAVGARAGRGRLMDDVIGFFLDPANWAGHDRHPEPAVRAPRDLRDRRRSSRPPSRSRSGCTSATRTAARASRSTSPTSAGRSRPTP